MSFTASFLTVSSLVHFLLRLRTTKSLIPRQASLHLQWRGLRIPVKSASEPSHQN